MVRFCSSSDLEVLEMSLHGGECSQDTAGATALWETGFGEATSAGTLAGPSEGAVTGWEDQVLSGVNPSWGALDALAEDLVGCSGPDALGILQQPWLCSPTVSFLQEMPAISFLESSSSRDKI
ncbi:hypothetical protein DV515_00013420 [Chloebia gouldiae]|uniref:Uncharacterized protein n=1 Tax=Chloebia gouldiae TaxID=44316 RepID=A0A3L8S1F1_CHLGU|nr:hypothetical protein DV515_00013420 [Chloebia gouldiae]